MRSGGTRWHIPARDRIHVPRELYAMDIREVARRLKISRGLAFILEKSALAKLRENGQMKKLLELSRFRHSLRSGPVFPDWGDRRMSVVSISGRPQSTRGFGIEDDLGVWLVVSDGPFATEDLAQAECNKRNFDDGVADENGDLLREIPVEQWNTFYVKHRSREDCTCRPTRDPLPQILRD